MIKTYGLLRINLINALVNNLNDCCAITFLCKQNQDQQYLHSYRRWKMYISRYEKHKRFHNYMSLKDNMMMIRFKGNNWINLTFNTHYSHLWRNLYFNLNFYMRFEFSGIIMEGFLYFIIISIFFLFFFMSQIKFTWNIMWF